MHPKVSVIMPVYNASRTLPRTLASLWRQTFENFEVIAIENASTDTSHAILQKAGDHRLRIIHHDANQGVAASLNEALGLSTAEYVARMDADDICLPNRLEKQVAYFDQHPATVALGSAVRFFGKYGPVLRRVPVGTAMVNAYALFDNPLYHPTVMLRRSALVSNALTYNPAYRRSEDYELWCRLAQFGALDNLTDVLLRFHVHAGSVTGQFRAEMEDQSLDIARRQLARLEIFPDHAQLLFHRNVGHGNRLASLDALRQAEKWLLQLIEQNNAKRVFDPEGIRTAAAMVWFRLCAHCGQLGWGAWRAWRASAFFHAYRPCLEEIWRMAASIVANQFRRK